MGVGFLSSLFIRNSMDIYQNLVKPWFAPPSSVFPPVWTILYILMGVASYWVWKLGKDKKAIQNALFFYAIQLTLNFLWPILFFRLDMRFIAFIEIVILFIFILITTIKFYRIHKVAGYLMVPYILWVAFATILNYSIWALNR